MLIKIRNHAKYQRYTTRNPPWVKLYRKILDDMSYSSLPAESWRLGLELLLLATEAGEGELETSIEELTFRLRRKIKSEHIENLVTAGFITKCVQEVCKACASGVQHVCAETDNSETETETETDGQLTPQTRAQLTRRWSAAFSRFWERYPRKVAKAQARKTWAKLQPKNGDLQKRFNAILKTLKTRDSEDWADRPNDKIPHASTFLNMEEWE